MKETDEPRDGQAELYGLMAEFTDEHRFLSAVQRTHDAGYQAVDAYSPFPVEGVADALDYHRTWLPQITLIGGIIGLIGGYSMQYWAAVLAYPINVGGRPLNTWPMFVPITYELTILVAAWVALLGMLVMNGLPQPYHPVFNVPQFARASQDRFFVVVKAGDPAFDYAATCGLLEGLQPRGVYDVPS